MKSMTLMLAAVWCFATTVAGAGETVKPETARPNLIILLQDDMGMGDFSAAGNPILRTPNLDRLREESVRFSQFHVEPMCTPSRGELLSGLHCLRNGARYVGTEATHLRTDLRILPELLREAGYKTGIFGKWHLGDNYPLRPQDRGFDMALWFPQAAADKAGDFWGNDYFDDTYLLGGKRKAFQGYCGDVWFAEAMKWMRQRAEHKEPFFAYLPNNLAHGPYFAPERHRQKYREAFKGRHDELLTYAAMVDNVDENIGRLDRFLRENGLYENTIVLYLHDNGASHGAQIHDAGLRGWKTQLWEGGHQSPLWIRWPAGRFGEAREVDGLAHMPDLLPTILELVAINPPQPGRLDGVSLAPALRAGTPLPDRSLVVQYGFRPRKGEACVLWRQWRLVSDSELYDVSQDPGQTGNVLTGHPDVVAKMRADYERWWASVQNDLKVVTPIVIGSDAENPSVLSPASWTDVYFVDNANVRSGDPVAGRFRLTVAQAGPYEISLFRWPEEVDVPIRAAAPPVLLTDPLCYGAKTPPGVALPVTEAELQLDDDPPLRLAVGERDKAAVFRVNLKPGPLLLRGLFRGTGAATRWGAYSIKIRRLPADGRRHDGSGD